MPFWRTYYHLVWATKNRAHLIQPDVEARLYPYLISKARELEVRVYAINGWTDHTHLVTSIPPKHAIAYVVKRLKGASSYDLNHSWPGEEPFNWQRGYGVFTLGESQLDRAIAYVQNQKQHHQQQTTNSWLERTNEFDEGPPDEGLIADWMPAILRESGPVYQVWREDEIPF
jgi:putative transposase